MPELPDLPDPRLIRTNAELVAGLRALRRWAGQPSLRHLRQLGGETVDRSGHLIDALTDATMSYVLRGVRKPSASFVDAFVSACLTRRACEAAVISQYVERWRSAWLRTVADLDERTGQSAVGTSRVVPRQLPPGTVYFTGREGQVAKIEALLSREDPCGAGPVVVAIDGMAGVGKTSLALHVAHRIADRFSDGQMFLDLRGFAGQLSPLQPAEALDQLLEGLEQTAERHRRDPQQRAALYRSLLAGRRFLIVLDNAVEEAQVRPLLPASSGCRVLVTSRRRLSGLEDAETVSLDPPSLGEAVEMFKRAIGADRVRDRDEALVQQLVELCGRLPLAVRIAGARLRARPAWSLAHLVTQLEDEQRLLEQLTVGERSVRATISVSYQQLTVPQRRMFCLLGTQPAVDVRVDTAAALASLGRFDAQRLLEDLLDVHLAHSPAAGRYGQHGLLRSFAAALAREEFGFAGAAVLERLLRHQAGTAWSAARWFPMSEHRLVHADPEWAGGGASITSAAEAISWWRSERHNLLATLQATAQYPRLAPAASQLTLPLYELFRADNCWQDCETANRIVLGLVGMDGDKEIRGQCHHDLGVSCLQQGKLPEALENLQATRVLMEELGNRHGLVAGLNGLSTTYIECDQPERAVELANESIALGSELGDQLSYGNGLHNLGVSLLRLQRYDEARSSLLLSVSTYREVGDRSRLSSSLGALAAVHTRCGQHDSAMTALRESLAISRAQGDLLGVARDLDNLGGVYDTLGNHEQAISCYRESAQVCRDLGFRQREYEVLSHLATSLAGAGQSAGAPNGTAGGAIHDRFDSPDGGGRRS